MAKATLEKEKLLRELCNQIAIIRFAGHGPSTQAASHSDLCHWRYREWVGLAGLSWIGTLQVLGICCCKREL